MGRIVGKSLYYPLSPAQQLFWRGGISDCLRSEAPAGKLVKQSGGSFRAKMTKLN